MDISTSKPLKDYLAGVESQLHCRRKDKGIILQELSLHIDDHFNDLLAMGLSEEEAIEKAVADMGSSKEVGESMNTLYSQPIASKLLTLSVAMLLVVFSVWFTQIGYDQLFPFSKVNLIHEDWAETIVSVKEEVYTSDELCIYVDRIVLGANLLGFSYSYSTPLFQPTRPERVDVSATTSEGEVFKSRYPNQPERLHTDMPVFLPLPKKVDVCQSYVLFTSIPTNVQAFTVSFYQFCQPEPILVTIELNGQGGAL